MLPHSHLQRIPEPDPPGAPARGGTGGRVRGARPNSRRIFPQSNQKQNRSRPNQNQSGPNRIQLQRRQAVEKINQVQARINESQAKSYLTHARTSQSQDSLSQGQTRLSQGQARHSQGQASPNQSQVRPNQEQARPNLNQAREKRQVTRNQGANNPRPEPALVPSPIPPVPSDTILPLSFPYPTDMNDQESVLDFIFRALEDFIRPAVVQRRGTTDSKKQCLYILPDSANITQIYSAVNKEIWPASLISFDKSLSGQHNISALRKVTGILFISASNFEYGMQRSIFNPLQFSCILVGDPILGHQVKMCLRDFSFRAGGPPPIVSVSPDMNRWTPSLSLTFTISKQRERYTGTAALESLSTYRGVQVIGEIMDTNDLVFHQLGRWACCFYQTRALNHLAALINRCDASLKHSKTPKLKNVINCLLNAALVIRQVPNKELSISSKIKALLTEVLSPMFQGVVLVSDPLIATYLERILSCFLGNLGVYVAVALECSPTPYESLPRVDEVLAGLAQGQLRVLVSTFDSMHLLAGRTFQKVIFFDPPSGLKQILELKHQFRPVQGFHFLCSKDEHFAQLLLSHHEILTRLFSAVSLDSMQENPLSSGLTTQVGARLGIVIS